MKAMELLIDKIKEDRAHNVIYLSFEPENSNAKSMYDSFGFRPDGRILSGEIVYKFD